MKSDMNTESTWIRTFIPSLISSLFKASKALFEIVNKITKKMRNKLDKKE
jgi:hypothetical protein